MVSHGQSSREHLRAFVTFSMACTVSKLAKMRGPVKGCVQESGGSRRRYIYVDVSRDDDDTPSTIVISLAPCWPGLGVTAGNR